MTYKGGETVTAQQDSGATRDEAEDLRREMPNREHYEVVEVPA